MFLGDELKKGGGYTIMQTAKANTTIQWLTMILDDH